MIFFGYKKLPFEEITIAMIFMQYFIVTRLILYLILLQIVIQQQIYNGVLPACSWLKFLAYLIEKLS